MSMTRKDFEAIAKIIKYHKSIIDPNLLIVNSSFNTMVKDLSYYFKEANSSFDKERFMKACGFNGEP